MTTEDQDRSPSPLRFPSSTPSVQSPAELLQKTHYSTSPADSSQKTHSSTPPAESPQKTHSSPSPAIATPEAGHLNDGEENDVQKATAQLPSKKTAHQKPTFTTKRKFDDSPTKPVRGKGKQYKSNSVVSSSDDEESASRPVYLM